MNEIAKVYETRDYDKFKILLGNRTIVPIQVTRLEQSMDERYLMAPIIVNENFEICDGQHRFQAAKNKGFPIRFIFGQGYGIKEVKQLNTHQKNWVKQDYLHTFCEMNLKEYVDLKKFQMRYDMFSLNICIMLLNDGQTDKTLSDADGSKTGTKRRSYSAKDFATGQFKILDYDLGCENAEKILEVKPYFKGYNGRSFVRAMVSIFKIQYYDHKRFIKRVNANPASITKCLNAEQYKYMIEEIYNFRSHDQVPLRFVKAQPIQPNV